MMQRLATGIILVVQGLLLAYELVAHYDTRGRQIALAITNLAAIAIFLAVQRWLRRRYGITIHWVVLMVIAASVWLDALGNFRHFYGGYWWWDRLTHAVGGLAVTVGVFFVCVALWRVGRLSLSWRALNLYAFCLAQILGAIYEVSEWVGDTLFGTHRVQGPYDTPRDLAFNMAGGLLVLLLGAWWRSRQRVLDPVAHARG